MAYPRGSAANLGHGTLNEVPCRQDRRARGRDAQTVANDPPRAAPRSSSSRMATGAAPSNSFGDGGAGKLGHGDAARGAPKRIQGLAGHGQSIAAGEAHFGLRDRLEQQLRVGLARDRKRGRRAQTEAFPAGARQRGELRVGAVARLRQRKAHAPKRVEGAPRSRRALDALAAQATVRRGRRLPGVREVGFARRVGCEGSGAPPDRGRRACRLLRVPRWLLVGGNT